MFVLQFFGHAFGLFGFDLLRRGAKRLVGFAIFWRATHVGGRVGEGNARFRHSDELDGLLRCDGERQRFGIGQADIFARKDDDASRDEAKVFAGVQHFREPVNRAFLVGRAHALDESADRIVVRVADAIVDDGFLLDAFLRDCEIEMIVGQVSIVRSRLKLAPSDAGVVKDANLESVQRFARIAIADFGEKVERFIGNFHITVAETAFRISQRAFHQRDQVVRPQRFQAKNLRARNERAVDVEKRIVGRRADQPQISALHVGQQNVLLRFVEVMDLIDKHDCFLAGILPTIGRRRHDAPHFCDVTFHAAQAHKLRLRHFGDDLRERRFSGSGRPGQNHRRQTIRFDRAAQKFAGRENMFLSDKFLERARSHACGERSSCVGLFRSFVFFARKQIVHAQKYLWGAQAASLHFSAACRKDFAGKMPVLPNQLASARDPPQRRSSWCLEAPSADFLRCEAREQTGAGIFLMKPNVSFLKLLIPAIAISFLFSCEKSKQEQKPKGDITDIAEPVVTPGWITFKPGAKINPKTLFKDHAALFHLPPGNEMVAKSEETDELGITHYRYQQFFREIKVENAEFLVRAKDGQAVSANGKLAYDFQPQTTAPQISEEQAWEIVHRRIPAERYFRDDKLVDDLTNQDATATGYRPKGQLLFTEDPNSTGGERRLVWMFKVYVTPFDKSRQIYINAADGSVVKELPLFPACYLGSGPVTFRGTKSMNTQKKDDRFYLVDDCDGTLLTAALLDTANKRVDISDDDNNWAGNNPSVVTSYWGLRAAYDYYHLIHNRLSYDGKNGNMTIFNDPNMQNAGQNATGGGGSIRIGLANPGDNDDYNTLDIIGHEFTHSVIEQTANLTYDATKESAALNESYCDIFGQMAEQWIEGGTKKEWVIGDDKGCVAPAICRDLLTPKNFNNPDTYKGTFWQTASIDPHNNGSVQNRWFALLCDGGTGTNAELGSAYNVVGVGMVKGRKIAYRTLTRYLTSASAFVDARAGSISAATDLYGENSSEVESVTNAWCAVGLCSYVIPTQADIFDRPGGNPNPASPNNNNTLAGATPLGTGSRILGIRGYPLE